MKMTNQTNQTTTAPTTAAKTTSEQIKVRACSIICIDHPEWGTWGVMKDKGGFFEIRGRAGERVLDKWEADNFWKIAA
jgi:hypothetical protein